MRAIVMLLALSTTILGAACAYLLWRDGGERAHPGGATDAATQTRIEALIAERERLRHEVDRGRNAAPCEEQAAPVEVGSRRDAAAGNPALASVRIGAGPELFERLPPEHRRTITRQRYGMVFHELSLSDADIDALLPILASHDEHSRPGFALSSPPRDSPEARAREREIAAVLGAEKAAQFAEVQRSMPARMEAQMLHMQLERSGAPLSEEQQRQLVAAMKDLGPPEPPPFPPGGPTRESIERFRAWRAERVKSVRELSAPVLTPRQLQRLEEDDSLQAALQAGLPQPADSP